MKQSYHTLFSNQDIIEKIIIYQDLLQLTLQLGIHLATSFATSLVILAKLKKFRMFQHVFMNKMSTFIPYYR